jgi:hypothetical protein
MAAAIEESRRRIPSSTRIERIALAVDARIGGGGPGGGGGGHPSGNRWWFLGGGVVAIVTIALTMSMNDGEPAVSRRRIRPPSPSSTERPSVVAEAPHDPVTPPLGPAESAAGQGTQAAPAVDAPPQTTPRPGLPPSELHLLQRARASLDGAPQETLRILSVHTRHYPEGQLAQEREVLAIETLLRLGRREEATARGRQFEREVPGSSHLWRIRRLLKGSSP